MVKKNNSDNFSKSKENIKMLIFLSLFLSIITTFRYITLSEDITLVVILTVIISFVFYLLLPKYLNIYNSSLIGLFKRFQKKSIGRIDKITSKVFLYPSIIASLSSLVIFIVSLYYLKKDISVLGDSFNYEAIVNNLSITYFPFIIGGFLLFIVLLQAIYLTRFKKVKWTYSLLFILISIILFSLIIEVTRHIIYGVLSYF